MTQAKRKPYKTLNPEILIKILKSSDGMEKVYICRTDREDTLSLKF
jgi:hypothetical protein